MQLVWKGLGSNFSSQSYGSVSPGVTYLTQTKGDLDVIYSNVPSSQVVYPNQAIVTYSAPVGQEVWILINSTRQVESVMVGNTTITRSPDYASLVAASYAASGWFGNTDGVTLVRFQSFGQGSVRVLLASPPPPTNRLVEDLVWVAPIAIIACAVGVGVLTWVTSIRRKARMRHHAGSTA